MIATLLLFGLGLSFLAWLAGLAQSGTRRSSGLAYKASVAAMACGAGMIMLGMFGPRSSAFWVGDFGGGDGFGLIGLFLVGAVGCGAGFVGMVVMGVVDAICSRRAAATEEGAE